MVILVKSNFKHGRMAFEAGKAYDVNDAYAGYFVGVGWAVPHDGEGEMVDSAKLGADAPTTAREGNTLEVQDVKLTTGN